MLKDKNPLLKLNLNDKNYVSNAFRNIYEYLYALYDYILEDPIENFWYECFSILVSYLQLISFSFDEAVS